MEIDNAQSAAAVGENPVVAWAKQNLAAGVDPEAVVSALIGQGWTELAARQVLDTALTAPIAASVVPTYAQATRVQAARPVVGYATSRRTDDYKAAMASAHLRNMGYGGLLLAVGLVITVGSFAMGRITILAWGPIIYGGIRFVSGFFGWVGSR